MKIVESTVEIKFNKIIDDFESLFIDNDKYDVEVVGSSVYLTCAMDFSIVEFKEVLRNEIKKSEIDIKNSIKKYKSYLIDNNNSEEIKEISELIDYFENRIVELNNFTI